MEGASEIFQSKTERKDIKLYTGDDWGKKIGRRPHFNTSGPHPEHEKFPYLLRKCKIERPNQVWSTDITYTVVAGQQAFVIGIVDWFSRKILAYNVNTMDAFHCVETLKMCKELSKKEICIFRLFLCNAALEKRGALQKDQLFSKNFFCSPEKFKKEFYSKIEHKKQQEMDQHGS